MSSSLELTDPGQKFSPKAATEVVFRDPARFGSVAGARAGNPDHTRLYRIPTILTAAERECVHCCDATGQTTDPEYPDGRQLAMLGCPMVECGHMIINNQMLLGSIYVRYHEFRPNLNKPVLIHYFL